MHAPKWRSMTAKKGFVRAARKRLGVRQPNAPNGVAMASMATSARAFGSVGPHAAPTFQPSNAGVFATKVARGVNLGAAPVFGSPRAYADWKESEGDSVRRTNMIQAGHWAEASRN